MALRVIASTAFVFSDAIISTGSLCVPIRWYRFGTMLCHVAGLALAVFLRAQMDLCVAHDQPRLRHTISRQGMCFILSVETHTS